MAPLLASIPSPPSGGIELGPLNLRAYGLMIALGVLAAVWLGRRRWAERGGDPDDMSAVALWAVPAGLIGARLYHVATDWGRLYDEGRWAEALKIWEGGLGIPGGIAAGVGVGVWAARRRGMPLGPAVDAVAPALPLAQAIGRLGNWFNQELFGRPTDLPWALEIDPENRPVEHLESPTFHPTFLYELLWNLGVVGLLLLIDRTGRLKDGKLLPLYLFGYFTGRLWVEALRIDTATEIAGLRVNTWMSLLVMAGALVWFLAGGPLRPDGERRPPGVAQAPAEPAAASTASESDGQA